jgi:hypothetical protein
LSFPNVMVSGSSAAGATETRSPAGNAISVAWSIIEPVTSDDKVSVWPSTCAREGAAQDSNAKALKGSSSMLMQLM